MKGYSPEELIVQILYYLPVKSLLRYTNVCKSWCSLIKSSNFISTHLVINRNNHPLLPLSLVSLHVPFTTKEKVCMMGSCNGIVCFLHEYKVQSKVLLWNPSIRKSLTLPLFNNIFSDTLIGFGFDSSSIDYKVFRMLSYKAEIYSLNANSWKKIIRISPFTISKINNRNDEWIGTFVNGALHWIVKGKQFGFEKSVIFVFNLGVEVFGEIILPNCLANISIFDLSVKAFGESSIAVIRTRNWYEFDVLVMKEYGVVDSWMKLVTVRSELKGSPRVLGFNNKENVFLLLDQGQIVSYNLETKQYKEVITYSPDENSHAFHNLTRLSSFGYTHVESLALYDKANIVADATSTDHPSILMLSTIR